MNKPESAALRQMLCSDLRKIKNKKKPVKVGTTQESNFAHIYHLELPLLPIPVNCTACACTLCNHSVTFYFSPLFTDVQLTDFTDHRTLNLLRVFFSLSLFLIIAQKRLNVCFGLSIGQVEKDKKKGDGCFASSLEFLTKFTLWGLVAK